MSGRTRQSISSGRADRGARKLAFRVARSAADNTYLPLPAFENMLDLPTFPIAMDPGAAHYQARAPAPAWPRDGPRSCLKRHSAAACSAPSGYRPFSGSGAIRAPAIVYARARDARDCRESDRPHSPRRQPDHLVHASASRLLTPTAGDAQMCLNRSIASIVSATGTTPARATDGGRAGRSRAASG